MDDRTFGVTVVVMNMIGALGYVLYVPDVNVALVFLFELTIGLTAILGSLILENVFGRLTDK